jgi:hypothetical protein
MRIDLVGETGLSSDMGKYGFFIFAVYLEWNIESGRIGLFTAWYRWRLLLGTWSIGSRTLFITLGALSFVHLVYRHQPLYFILN